MNYYEALANAAKPVDIAESDTSYFSKPESKLDPRIFRNNKLIPTVREAILILLFNHLELGYNEPTAWATAYLAGSGVSYQWSAHREPGDLDCLVSVDYVQFRQSNQEYKGWSDKEIAAEINQGFRNELHPRTERFMETYELTFYVNLNPSIAALKPYAAYSVTNDIWVVPPVWEEPPSNPEWEALIEQDRAQAMNIVQRYSVAMDQIKNSTNPAARLNAENYLAHAVHQGSALFEDIHGSRSNAFSPEGSGYADFNNYRWQAGKKSGVVGALKMLHQVSGEATAKFSKETYGMELPDTSTLLRRAYKPQ
jgi:hypothetical protein